MWSKRILKFFAMCIVLLGIFQFCILPVCALDSTDDVSILLLDESMNDNSKINVTVQVNFYNIDLYNEQVYLSYHIYDDKGETVINENERLKIDLDSQGGQRFELTIDLSEAKKITKEDELVVVFDIIDEKNVYWFSTSDTINVDFASLSAHWSIGQKLLAEMRNDKFIFGINVVVFLVSVVAVPFSYKKIWVQ